MIALIQRVSEASVQIEDDGVTPGGTVVGRIGRGLLALVCAERCDTEREADRLLERLLGYRVFADQAGKMNRSLMDVHGQLMIVSQFTLAADTSSGMRPSFTPAAPPAIGERLYQHFVRRARQVLEGEPRAEGKRQLFEGIAPAVATSSARVATGRFGADMKVSLINDGPVTFWLRVPPAVAASASTQNLLGSDGAQRA